LFSIFSLFLFFYYCGDTLVQESAGELQGGVFGGLYPKSYPTAYDVAGHEALIAWDHALQIDAK